MKKILTVVSVSLILAACGGSGGGLNKDSKVDFYMDAATLNALDASNDEAKIKEHDDKVIETKGVIKSFKEAKHSSSPNKYSFYLCVAATDEDTDCIICYTDKSPEAFVGKTVTVKGKMSYAGVITLINCAVY